MATPLDKRDKHIRDRLVVGIHDKELSRKFQLKVDLMLLEVIEQVRQAEDLTKFQQMQAVTDWELFFSSCTGTNGNPWPTCPDGSATQRPEGHSKLFHMGQSR